MPDFFSRMGLILISLLLGSVAFSEPMSNLRYKAETKDSFSKKWSGEWSVAAGGESFSEGKDEGTGAFTTIKGKFTYRFAEFLKLKAKPRFDFFSARVQERYENDHFQTRFRLTEGYLSVTPIEAIELNAGAINQEYLNSRALLSYRRAFPGVQEAVGHRFELDGGFLTVRLVAEQTVPTSYAMDTERKDKEPLPSFNTEALSVIGKWRDSLEWDVTMGHYTWANIPSSIAHSSKLAGNSVIGTGPTDSRMVAEFDGVFLSSELCACNLIGPVGLVGEFERVHNGKAGEGLQDAQTLAIGPRLIFKDIDVDLRYRRFFSEKDTTVAVYSSSSVGGTNRMGDAVEMKIDFKKHGFALNGWWANAVPIRENDFQKTWTAIKIGVESHYAPF